MGFFDGADDDDFLDNNNGRLSFNDNEIVRFKILSSEENKQYNFTAIKTIVLTGPNEGKSFDLIIREKPAHTRRDFMFAFWTREQLKTKEARLSDLVNKTFEAKCKHSEYQGKNYQNWEGFKKITASLDEVNA